MEQYGSGIAALSERSGVPADVIEKALDIRKEKYHKTYAFDEKVKIEVEESRIPTNVRTIQGFSAGFGTYKSVTGTRYGFLEVDAPEWKQHSGDMTAFPIPVIMNYPSQGLGGEIMQVQAGRVFRALLEHNLLSRIVMINTVHDSIYLDVHKDFIKYLPAIAGLLEDVSPYFNKVYNTNWDTPFKVTCEYGNNMLELTETVIERSDNWI